LPPGYAPGEPIPAGYHLAPRHLYGLIIGGSVLAAAGYGLGLAGLAARRTGHFSAVPIIGPFITAVSFPRGECTILCLDGLYRFTLIFSSLMQAGGAAMIGAGIGVKRWKAVRDEAPIVVPVPIGVPGGGGLGLVGAF
jgi:hypothetical protein